MLSAADQHAINKLLSSANQHFPQNYCAADHLITHKLLSVADQHATLKLLSAADQHFTHKLL